MICFDGSIETQGMFVIVQACLERIGKEVMKGLFELKTARDLFAKLEWEYESLSSDSKNSYLAYNFFVTSWHLLEWLYPDNLHDKSKQKEMKSKREEIKALNPILQVCEHLAVGAKHFKPTHSKLKSVSETGRSSYWAKGYWHPNYWHKNYWRDALVVQLIGDAQTQFGENADVLRLANEAITFWRKYMNLNQERS